jgi:murein DD-endopeptidase MepM/ murein hydrolase activator NlpD
MENFNIKGMLIFIFSLFMTSFVPTNKPEAELLIVTQEVCTVDTVRVQEEIPYHIFSSQPHGSPIDAKDFKRSLTTMSGFGRRFHPIHQVLKMHAGLDIPAREGTPIKSTSHGVVKKVRERNYGYGKYVIIESGPYQILYGHCSELLVEEGDYIEKGQIIGKVGNTGTSTGPHLHYEVRVGGRPVDPKPFVNGNINEL